MKRKWVPALALVPAAALAWIFFVREGPEIAACEDFIKGELRSPSTYRRIAVAMGDEPTDASQIAAMNDGHRPSGEQTLSLRTVDIEYDADNAYGTPVRGAQICAFVKRDGNMPSEIIMKANVTSSSLRRAMRRVREEEGLSQGPPPRYSCCM